VTFSIRRAGEQDAADLCAVLEVIAAERIYSAIDRPFSPDQQRAYLRSLTPREAFFVAVDGTGLVIGYQSVDRWAPLFGSMDHVAQFGTFLLPEARGRGAGRALAARSLEFAREAGYEKVVVQVRGSNTRAQAFYRRLGFVECGRLSRQVRLWDTVDDEVLMEYFVC
jgi:ribosomal protein S18 acetylase RimI-like enzyme